MTSGASLVNPWQLFWKQMQMVGWRRFYQLSNLVYIPTDLFVHSSSVLFVSGTTQYTNPHHDTPHLLHWHRSLSNPLPQSISLCICTHHSSGHGDVPTLGAHH